MLVFFFGRNSTLSDRTCQSTAGFKSTCAQTSEQSSSQFRGDVCSSMSSSQTIVGFKDRDYRYKSIATQIPPNIGLAPIPYTGRTIFPHRLSNQRHTSSKLKPRDHGARTNTHNTGKYSNRHAD